MLHARYITKPLKARAKLHQNRLNNPIRQPIQGN